MEWVLIRGSQSRDGVGEGLWGGDHGTWGLRQWWGAPPRLYCTPSPMQDADAVWHGRRSISEVA